MLSSSNWLTVKDIVRVNGVNYAKKVAIKDLNKSFTYKEWDERTCKLANALAELGLKKGDRFAALGYNCVEWMEIYVAAAKGGFICVPLMFRLAGPENGVDHEPLRGESNDRPGRLDRAHEWLKEESSDS